MMKLHRDNGVIEFPRGSFGPATTRLQFLDSSLSREAEVVVDNEPYVTWRIRPEPGVAATLSFEGQRLCNIAWAFALSTDKDKVWSEALELERKRIHDEWLLGILGPPPYRFEWGVVESGYDDKGCSSDIIVAYAR